MPYVDAHFEEYITYFSRDYYKGEHYILCPRCKSCLKKSGGYLLKTPKYIYDLDLYHCDKCDEDICDDNVLMEKD